FVREGPPRLRAVPSFRPERPQHVPGASGGMGHRPRATELLRLLLPEPGRRQGRGGLEGPRDVRPLEARPALQDQGARSGMKLNVLVFGPHPDDAEIGCGGLLLKMKDLGYATGIVDMTRGDMGWGTPEQRDRESEEAGRLLKLDIRENLDLGDNRVEDTF